MIKIKKVEVIQTIDQIVEITCGNCGTEIERPYQPQTDNMKRGLRVSFSGGYGEYIDGYISDVLCCNCAEKLVGSFPKLFERYLDANSD